MYYPYFRGKQFELITIREMAQLLADNNFIPVIEPVRESLNGLKRALEAINEAGGKAIVIVNPYYGDHQDNGSNISSFLEEEFSGSDNISAGILLRNGMSVDDAMSCFEQHASHNRVLVHAGFTEPKDLATKFERYMSELTNIFIDDYSKLLYRKHFGSSKRILIRDGFNRQRNADYPEVEMFSELHATYPELGMEGFGDFLMVGDAYSEGGGPAYAVAIHLTFIDRNKDDVMYIYHFVSDTKDTPTDPAGKFGQALGKLIRKLESGNSGLLETNAIKEFKELYKKRHFPGLGYVKKLSMKHHIETLVDYLK
ncbi:sce7725 family protein [Vibrio alginolyticus]|uniref:sce7725 family protein n=1 Tax=Vibrio alginolyticus TaxID=663 RepID=UPI001BD3A663|nr:sce7725 family protein [Vibrio alginolyticus]MBT0086510.1 sce7725 family protein [Vibrio alginolyticus]